MSQESSGAELVELVKAIQTVRDQKTGHMLTEAEHTAPVAKFKNLYSQPLNTDSKKSIRPSAEAT